MIALRFAVRFRTWFFWVLDYSVYNSPITKRLIKGRLYLQRG